VARIAAAYRQMPPYCWVEERFVALHYAHAACAGPAEVQVTVLHAAGGGDTHPPVRIHPLRRGIAATWQGDTLCFAAEDLQPRYLLVNIGELPLLCILLDPPEVEQPTPGGPGVVNLTAFLGGAADATEAFRLGIRAVDGTGATLYIPAGEYVTGTIHIQQGSNFRLYFQPGAILRTRRGAAGTNEHLHGLWFDRCRDVTLFGRGCLDQQGYEHFALGGNDYKHGMISWEVPNALNPYTTQSPLFVTHCQNILVEGLTLRNGRNFNVNLRRSDNVTLRNCHVLTPPASVPEYTDGYQINACHGTLLENCFAFCNDDCIACGHYFYSHDDREQCDTRVRGFVGWNARANGLRIGFYSHYDLGDYVFENCDFIGADDSAVLIHALRDSHEARRYQRYGLIRFADCGFDLCGRMVTGLLHVDRARIASLEFERVAFDQQAPAPSLIEGHPQDGGIGRLLLRQVTIGGAPLTDLQSAHVDVANVGEVQIER
jgi:hypothetical protein